jgi:hypothetical protein
MCKRVAGKVKEPNSSEAGRGEVICAVTGLDLRDITAATLASNPSNWRKSCHSRHGNTNQEVATVPHDYSHGKALGFHRF